MTTYSKISLSQIDKDALSDYVVSKKKLVYRTDTAGNKAQDVDKVGGQAANIIAVASSTADRTTVRNAQNLDGYPASYFMTLSGGNSVITKQNKVRAYTQTELQNIEDELYTLRQELAKAGFIEDRGEYQGYVDTFRTKRPKHLSAALDSGVSVTDAAEKNEIFVEQSSVFNSLTVYDFIVVEAPKIEKFVVRQIASKDTNRKVLVLNEALPDDIYLSNNTITLYLSHGVNDEGMFKFARAAEYVMGSDDNHTGLSDDVFQTFKRMKTTNAGFGYTFRVPAEKQGFVISFEVCAKAHGTPGAMRCYLIDERDVEKFQNPTQAKSDYEEAKENGTENFHFFAASQPLVLDYTMGKRYIRFSFLQDNEKYPILPMDDMDTMTKVRYCAIIECLDVDAENYYDLLFLQHQNADGDKGDLELNNITYNYTRRATAATRKALVTDEDVNASDMYYHIVTRDAVEKEVEPDNEGLYSFHVSTKDPVTRARVMMRIRKEGAYVINQGSDVANVPTGSIKIKNGDVNNPIITIADLRLKTENYLPLEVRPSDAMTSQQIPCIMGSNITEIQGLATSTVTTKSSVLIKKNDPVYRMGYYVCLKARKVTFAPGDTSAATTAWKHFNLPITEVFRDFFTYDKTASDRLIFEANLFTSEADVQEFNDFIVQIYWANPEMSTYRDIKKAQMGAIKDIAVSFNQGF